MGSAGRDSVGILDLAQPLPVVVDRRPPLWLVAVALLSAGTALGALLT